MGFWGLEGVCFWFLIVNDLEIGGVEFKTHRCTANQYVESLESRNPLSGRLQMIQLREKGIAGTVRTDALC